MGASPTRDRMFPDLLNAVAATLIYWTSGIS
jgi:hypothetical protein